MKREFIIKIIVPALMVIVLFVTLYSMIFLPMVERGFMDRKKEMIMELTNSVWSVIDEYYQEIERGNLSEEMAREMAVNRVKFIRYGDEGKDYFWITDMEPVMIMHPYRDELNGENISNYTDPQGTRLFAEAVEKVRESGDGYIDYWWQWKDDSTRIVPKLSYVKAFEPWNWIVGTGIYLEDVKEEMSLIRGRLVRTTLLFAFLIAVIVFYIIRQNLITERGRIDAEEKLKQSRLKYKKLVEASTEGTMMWLNRSLIYFNKPVLDRTGYTEQELQKKGMSELFCLQNGNIEEFCDMVDQSRNTEAILITSKGLKVGVVLTISRIEINERQGFIFIVKEVTRQLLRDKSVEMLQEEMRSSMQLMNSPVRMFVRVPVLIDMDRTVLEAADLMGRKQTDLLLVTRKRHEIVGILYNDTLISDVVAGKMDRGAKVFNVMKSPVTYIREDLPLFEAQLIMENERVEYLAIRNGKSQLTGYIGKKDVLEAQQNHSLMLIRKIEKAETVSRLQSLYDKLPGIISLLLGNDSNYRNISHVSTAVSDAITRRLIELSIERTGNPPTGFAFVSLGSEGREEQSLKTDQDNAIIYQGEKKVEVDEYFHELAVNINTGLNDIGYDFCKGKIMAGNRRWCQPVSVWKEYFKEWVENSDPESILDTSVFFDLRYVYGDRSIVDELKHEISRVTDSRAVFYTHLAQSVLRHKPIAYSDKQETIDLKKALMPVVGFARVYALRNNVDETNTIYRLKGIIGQEKISSSFVEEIIEAYQYIMCLRFRLQSRKILSNEKADNLLRTDELTNVEKAALKAALTGIPSIHTQLGFDFEVSI
jgi:PAS domain S-box-containing protein